METRTSSMEADSTSASLEFGLTPGGAVAIRDAGAGSEAGRGWRAAVRAAFRRSWPEGLLVLGGVKALSGAHASAAFWQAFAGRYVTCLCHVPDATELDDDPIAPPGESDLVPLVLAPRRWWAGST